MNVVMEQSVVTVETTGEATQVAIRLDTELKVSPEYAQDLIRRLLRQVGSFLRAETPELLVGQRLAWRVPVVMSLPECGDLGIVDWFTVDGQGRGFDLKPGRVVQLAYRAQAMAQALPPEKAPPEFKVRVPATVARRRVGLWIAFEVSDMMHADPPRLVSGKRTVWSVPVILTSTYHGAVGEVGCMEVDAETGEMLGIGEELAERMRSTICTRW